jgi:cytosine/adenosine deaminase-related metal-dependent hydrolase
MEAEDYNMLIAKFLDKVKPAMDDYIDYYELNPHVLMYHKSWDWLMEAVEKIESIQTKEDGYFGFYISSNTATIQGTRFAPHLRDKHDVYFSQEVSETKLEAAWLSVVKFIMWYNKVKDERQFILR